MDFWDSLKKWLDEHKYDNKIYAVCLFFGLVVSVYLFISNNITSNSGMIKLLVLWTLVLVVCIYIFVNRLFPFSFKDKNCILLVFQTFGKKDRKILEKYFISEIRSAFLESDISEMKVLFLPEYQTNRFFQYNQKKKIDVICNSGVKMCLWGSGRMANSKGVSVYSLDFNILIRHDELPTPISRYLSAEMTFVSESIRKVEIPMDDSASRFPELSNAVEYTADFIVACALLYTGHYDEAIGILEPLNALIKGVSRNIPSVAYLKHIIPLKLCSVYAVQAELAYERYFKDKDKAHLETMHEYIERQARLGAKGDSFYGQKALFHFCWDRDLKKARECVNACQKGQYPGYICRFDKVFLGLYESFSNSKLCNAYRNYKTILKNNPDWRVDSSAEEFIADLLENEPERVQMNWLICILENVKGDYKLSEEYLSVYERETTIIPDKNLMKYIDDIHTCNSAKKSIIKV